MTRCESDRFPEYVVYHSRGKCLIVGECGEIETLLTRSGGPADIHVHVLVTDRPSRRLIDECEAGGYPLIQGRLVELRGHLGCFRVTREVDGGGSTIETFDLVVDLSRPPVIEAEVVPFGYFVPGEGRCPDLDGLSQWVGEFEKPRYFSYRQDLCAHGGSRHRGCRSCLEACPAQAIVSVAEKRIEVDPYLCQGCGDCAAACPSGALEYRAVERRSLLETLFAALSRLPGAGVIFHPEALPVPDRFSDADWIKHPLPSVAACGPEIWLALVAAGASQIRLQRQGLLSGSQENLERQMRWVNALLEGLGYGRDRIAWLEAGLPVFPGEESGPGRMAPMADKRDVLELALYRLLERTVRLPERIPLPQGAPLGSVTVDGENCTLCFACVAVCPAQALQTGHDGFQLRLVEQNCLQCGWCADICPEDAIRLEPRLLVDGERRRQPRLLHEEPALRCLECGKEFANRKMIEAVLAKIGGHSMFADARKRRRLLLCEDCRVRDMMRDHEQQ